MNTRMTALHAESGRVHRTSLWVLGVALATALVLAVVLSTWVTRSVIGPLGVVVRAPVA